MSIEMLDVDAVAAILGCKPTTVQDRARSGELPGLLFGDGGWRFPAGALARRLDELAIEQAQERRKPRAPVAIARPAPAAPPARRGRKPPVLPDVPR